MPEIIPCPDQITFPKGGDEDRKSYPSSKHKQIPMCSEKVLWLMALF